MCGAVPVAFSDAGSMPVCVCVCVSGNSVIATSCVGVYVFCLQKRVGLPPLLLVMQIVYMCVCVCVCV